jgi:hypothetical protein
VVSGSHQVQQNQEEREVSKRHKFDQYEDLHGATNMTSVKHSWQYIYPNRNKIENINILFMIPTLSK